MTSRGISRLLPRRLPSPAMIVACLALTVALGGTSYAAIRLPANSVGTKQLKRGAVTGVKVKRDTLTGSQINETRLGLVRIASTANSAPISRVAYQRAATPIPSPGTARATANCETGLTVLGGGAKVSSTLTAFVIDTNPLGTRGWEASAAAEAPGATLTVYAICGSADTVVP
jgi:hypothetical protein